LQLFAGIRYEEYGFEEGPYLGFPYSHDVYGDGSIVVVPAPGHTPGSVIIFVTLHSGMRYAFVGDLVWQLEGITLREGAPLAPCPSSPSYLRTTCVRLPKCRGSVDRLTKILSLQPCLRFKPGLVVFLRDDLSMLGERAQEAHYL